MSSLLLLTLGDHRGNRFVFHCMRPLVLVVDSADGSFCVERPDLGIQVYTNVPDLLEPLVWSMVEAKVDEFYGVPNRLLCMDLANCRELYGNHFMIRSRIGF